MATCKHHDCKSFRAAELASQGRTLHAVRIHDLNTLVPCRRFNVYLQRVRPDLALGHDKQTPLASRIAQLQKRGASEEQVKDLMRLWDEWRFS